MFNSLFHNVDVAAAQKLANKCQWTKKHTAVITNAKRINKVDRVEREAKRAVAKAKHMAEKTAVAEATAKLEAEAAAEKAAKEAEAAKAIAARFNAACSAGKLDKLVAREEAAFAEKATLREARNTEKREHAETLLRAISEIAGDIVVINSEIEMINEKIDRKERKLQLLNAEVKLALTDRCPKPKHVFKLMAKIEDVESEICDLRGQLSTAEACKAELREEGAEGASTAEKLLVAKEIATQYVIEERRGGNELQDMVPVYHRVAGTDRLIVVMEYSNSVAEMAEYATADRAASILRFDWKEHGYARPINRWVDSEGRVWLLLTASQDDLKSGGEIMVEESFFKLHEAVLARPATAKIALSVKAAGFDAVSAMHEYESRWDELTIAEFEAAKAKQRVEVLAQIVAIKDTDDAKNTHAEAATEAKAWIDRHKSAETRFTEADAWFKRSPSKAKWTTQKALQTVALALTPSRNIGVIFNSDNTVIVKGITYECDVREGDALSKVSCVRGNMKLERVSKYTNTGWDGQFYLSKKALKKAVLDGELSKADYATLVRDRAVQCRGYNPDEDGWFALKGVAIVIDDEDMKESEIVDFDGRSVLWTPGMHILTTDVVKDTALYNTADKSGHAKFFAQRRQLRLCAFNWECGKIETGRQTIQPITQMSREEILEAINDTVEKLQESRTPRQYRETVLKRIRSILCDLTDEQFRLIEPLWMHPSMTMSEVKSKFCGYNSALAGKLTINGFSGIVVGEVKAHLDCILYGADPRTAGTLGVGDIAVPEKWGILPGAIGMADRYPYTSPLYKEVRVARYSTGNFIEVSMKNGELIMPILSMDFDGDHMGVNFDKWFVEAARRSNEFHKELGATYLIYDDNGSKEWIACCHKAKYIQEAPDLGSAGIATAPLFLLFSLIPSATQWEKKFGTAPTKASYATMLLGGKRVYVLLKEEYVDGRLVITRKFVSTHCNGCVTLGEIMEWIMYISADVTWQVDAVKRAAKSPFADSYQGRRMKAFVRGLYAASQWHDHMFDENVIEMADRQSEGDPDNDKVMIGMDNLCVIDRIAMAIQTRFKLKPKTEVRHYAELRRSAVKSENSKALIDLVFDPKLIRSTMWGADKAFNPIPWRMVLKQVEDPSLRKLTTENKLAFDPTFKSYGSKVWLGKNVGFVSVDQAKKLILMADKFDTRIDTDEFADEQEKFDRLNITPNNNGCIDIGVYVTRLLRVMLRWNAKESDPRKKKDVTESAYEIGRQLCSMVIYADHGVKISEKDADILLYRMFVYFLLGKSPYGTVGDELLFVLTYYSAKEWNGKPNEHRYLTEQMQLYIDSLSDPYNDPAKTAAWEKWAYNTHPVVQKVDAAKAEKA